MLLRLPLCRVHLYLAQHHDRLGNTGQALAYVERCLEVRLGAQACIEVHRWEAGGGQAWSTGQRLPEGQLAGCTPACAARPPARPPASEAAPPPRAAPMQHTPTLLEAYTAKAKILKHAGGRRAGGHAGLGCMGAGGAEGLAHDRQAGMSGALPRG